MEDKQLREKFAENSNIIGFVIVMFLYIGVSFFSGAVHTDAFNGFTTVDWIVFFVYPLTTAVIGSIAKSFLKKQGIRHGFQDEEVNAVHKELLELQALGKPERIPESYKAYAIKGSIKGTFGAFIFSVALTTLTTIMVLDFSLTNILTMFTTLGVWVGLGINDYSLMVDYIKNNHIVRMRYEIKEIKNERN